MRQNTMKTMWTVVPYRARITSRKVCALGARRFNSMARVAKRRICTVAPIYREYSINNNRMNYVHSPEA